ncbi:MAG: ferritin family protein [Desulfotomaculaceae bacterium]|nr:ferritin family protein [Desulfotomaculaceae bacterium]MDD4766749.1 ferritin family protein [Desulfotomaculaceae bacterium]
MAEEYKKILSIAVQSEIDAYELYTAISEKAKDASVKQLFKELAGDELQHKEDLEAYLKTDAKPLVFAETIDYKVSETVVKPEISLNMKFVDAVALAMKREQEGMDMYTALANASQSAEQKQIFEALALMEKGHKAKLEAIYNNAAFAEVW